MSNESKPNYKAHYDVLVQNGVPPEVAAAASEVTANEDGTQPRTPQQQQAVTAAWHYLRQSASQRGEQNDSNSNV